VHYLIPILAILILSGGGYSSAYAHTTVESPSEGVKSGITNAFKNLQSTIRMGGVTKVLDINSDPRPGHYFSKIIPTKTGSLVIELKGEINGVPVDIEIPIEDVETTAILDFPASSGSSSGQEVAALKNAMSSLQKDVTDIKSKLGGVDVVADNSQAYDFAIFALSLGAAGVILAIIAMKSCIPKVLELL
jgi:hypothetical protein